MNIRTFRAASLQAALDLVRRELGPDASVLQTRQIGTGLLGLGRKQIEVQASKDFTVARRIDDHVAPSPRGPQRESRHEPTSNLNQSRSIPGPSRTPEPPRDGEQLASPISRSGSQDQALENFIRRQEPSAGLLRNEHAVGGSSSSSPIPNVRLSLAALEVLTELFDAGMEPELAKNLVLQVAQQLGPAEQEDHWIIRGRLCQIVQRHIQVSGPLESQAGTQQIIAAVGPTGVGKTTTLAKLAAGFHFDDGHQVGFISIDTFRLGAIEQLRQHAEMVSGPIEIVRSPDQMQRAIHRLQDCHTVMVDTSGQAPSDRSQLLTLREFMRAACPTSIHLVLSAASSIAHAQATLHAFESIGPTHLMLTKLDEVNGLGGWYRTLKECTLPLSYITTGQQVPQDILAANRRRLAGMILGQAST